MTITPVAGQEKNDASLETIPAKTAQADFAAALFSSSGRAISRDAARDAASLGGDRPDAKRKDEEKETVRRAKARTDPTALASAELATHGVPKATTQAAVGAQVTPSAAPARPVESKPKSSQRSALAASGEPRQAAPRQSSPSRPT